MGNQPGLKSSWKWKFVVDFSNRWGDTFVTAVSWTFWVDNANLKPTLMFYAAATFSHPVCFFLFLRAILTVFLCSCGVLWSLKPNGAPADGDDELQLGLPHPPLGGHAHALVEASSSHSVIGSPSCPLLLEVDT